jgi:DNA polymerase-1
MAKKRLIVIDSNAVIHRAFHALPPLTTKKGELVNAVYGFILVFFKAIKEFNPDFVVAAFDLPGATFRHKKYKSYKANRPKTPDELASQIPIIKDILKRFNVSIFEEQGYEADDVIGTISKSVPKKQVFPEIETIILTGDMDILQLVDKNTKAYALRKGVKDVVLYDKESVKEKYHGLIPDQLTDYKALRGDPSDNIPGITGIGEKTAISLIKEFDNLDNIYKEIDENSQKARKLKPFLKEKLLNYKEQAYISKMLAQIRYDAPIDFKLANCVWGKYDKKDISEIFEKYNFKSLISRLPELEGRKKKEKRYLPHPKHRKKAQLKII